ncbi:hypothetical protein D3C81_1636530 [compost metagenome]
MHFHHLVCGFTEEQVGGVVAAARRTGGLDDLLAACSVRVVGGGVHLPGKQAWRVEVGEVLDHMQQLAGLRRVGQEQVHRLTEAQRGLDLDGVGVPLRVALQVDQHRPDQLGGGGDFHGQRADQVLFCGHGIPLRMTPRAECGGLTGDSRRMRRGAPRPGGLDDGAGCTHGWMQA